MNLEEITSLAEEHIRSGRRDQARDLLLRLRGKPIPRGRAKQAADLARRTGLYTLALQIMMPIIRPKVALDHPATNEEISCYAINLLGFGASLEALDLLEQGSPDHPDILLAKAFARMNRWDYLPAVQHLSQYLKTEAPSPYEKMIAKVNLAASLVASFQVNDSRQLIDEILETTKENSWFLLHKNCLEIGSQLAVQEKDWARAFQMLEQASKRFENLPNSDDFLIEKWKAIAEIERDGATPKAIELLAKVQLRAGQLGHWETIRDCDYYKALALKDRELFLQVYFGTPFQSYRDRIAERTKEWVVPPHEYVRQMQIEPSEKIFDLAKGEELGGSAKLKPGKSLYNALATLVSDSYKPFIIGNLHAAVFPKEFFNPVSSPRRISFLLHRLRDWFQENEMPLQIEFSKEGYRLKSSGPYAFNLVSQSQTNDKSQDDPAHYLVMLSKLQSDWSAGAFTALDVASKLGISERSARYFIKWATDKNHLEKFGSGRSTQYKMAS